MIAIFDLDNCISNDLWRSHAIKHEHSDLFERYHHYHSLAPFDEAVNTYMVTHHVSKGDYVLIVTARPEWYRHMTEGWLTRNSIHFDELLMRPNDDHSHSTELKIRLISEAQYSVDEIVVAYDDRHDVIDAYRAAGINAERLFIDDHDHGEKKK